MHLIESNHRNGPNTLMNWVKLKRYCQQSGLTRNECYANIQAGYWPKGIIWHKSPNGRIYINPREVDNWVTGNLSVTTGERTQ